MATKPSKKAAFNPRTARAPAAAGDKFIVAAGAPRHYISGFGLVGPGAVVTIPTGSQPGDHLYPISDKSAAEAERDDNVRAKLADDARRMLGPIVSRNLTRFAKSRAEQAEQATAAADVVNNDPAVLEAERIGREQADAEAKAQAKAQAEAEKQAKAAGNTAGGAKVADGKLPNKTGAPGGDKPDPAGPGKSDATT